MISDRIVYPSLFGAVAAAVVAFGVGCGSSYPAPTQPLADAEAADRSAQELGASSVPAAQLHLKLAQEQTNTARQLMKDGENKRAEAMLLRAKADAELALSLAKEEKAKTGVQQAVEKSSLQNQVNQGAAK
jgi:ParB-like chromosome segregation protein Spo0J